ncbi:hypothetical protein Taro_034878 [Colocasia esculenta]|uniref:Uncharacterized protein n=1 Tax=Colocasia esculenta TaxID=4460 RepID=A0A843VXJ0_COLES|nr:hypothetical protein [Colocasia esculenta]
MEELETTMVEKFAKMESMIMGSQGDVGYQDSVECSNVVAQLLHDRPESVLIESTGVIGQRIKKVPVLKRYPAKLFVTTFTCLFGLPHFLAIAAFT